MIHTTPKPTLGQSPSRQAGSVLIASLVLLIILTIVAMTASRRTALELQMTTNSTLKTRAFESAEGGRAAVLDVLDRHVNSGGWPTSAGGSLAATSGFELPDGLALEDSSSRLYIGDAKAGLGDYAVAQRDFSYRQGKTPASGQTAPDSPLQMWSDLYVTKVGRLRVAGSGGGVGGYTSTGTGTAASGVQLVFDVRSRGEAQDGARAITGSVIRIVKR